MRRVDDLHLHDVPANVVLNPTISERTTKWDGIGLSSPYIPEVLPSSMVGLGDFSVVSTSCLTLNGRVAKLGRWLADDLRLCGESGDA
jgi:hypothetical protein